MDAVSALISRPLALALGWAIVQSLWQITLVAVFSAAALAAARRATANVRYAIAVTGLGVMLAWPAATAREFISVEHHTPVMRADIAPVSLAEVRQSTRISRAADQAVPGSFSRTTSGRMDRFLPYATLIWAIGVVVLAIRAVGGWAVAQRLRRHGIACPTVQWQARFDRLLPRLRIGKRVTLLQSQLVDVPTVIGWLKPVVLVPASAFAGLAPQQLEAILVHELAHIRRQDYLANLVQTVVETLLFYHPAAWWLSRVARAEREHCCDDVAVAMVGNRVEYARALADLEVVRRAVPSLTLGADGGSLLHRVSRVLGAEDAHDRRRPDWVVSAVALVAIAVVLPGLSAQSAPSRTSLSGLNVQPAQSGRTASPPPVPPAPPTPPAPPVAPSVPAYNVDGKGCISNSSPAGKWEACYSGSVTLTSDDTDIQQLSAGGSFTANEGGWFSSRSVEIVADASGQLRRRYYTGFREQPYEPEGRRLLSALLKRMVRSGFAAPQRVSHLLEAGGPNAVLREISTLDSDFAKRIYYAELFTQATLDAPTLARAIADAGREVSSDFEIAELLIAAAPHLSGDPSISSAFFDAARGIGSDFEHRRVLSAVLETGGRNSSIARMLLDSSGGIESDFEHAEFLIGWLRRNELDSLAREFFHQVDAIGSSFEQARVFFAVLDSRQLSDAALAAALRSAGSIDGAFERSQVLQRAARMHEISGDARAAYLAAADTLDEGFEKDQVYAALVRAERRAKH